MNIDHSEIMWLDEHHEVSIDELEELSGLSQREICLLVEYGALMPLNITSDDWHFSSHCVTSIRRLSRLKQDFELEPNSLGLMLVFLEQIRMLESRLSKLENHHDVK